MGPHRASNDSLAHGCLLGAVFGAVWLSTEALFHAMLGKVGLGAALLANLGLGAPLVLGVSALSGGVLSVWVVTWWPRVKALLVPADRATALTHSAIVLDVIWCVGCVLLGSLVAAPALFSVINTALFATAVLLLVQGVALGLAIAALPVIHRVTTGLLSRLSQVGWLGARLRPLAILSLLGVLGCLAAFFAIPATSRAVLPWERLAAPVVGFLVTSLVQLRLAKLPRRLVRWAAAGSCGVMLPLTGVGALSKPSAAIDQVREAKGVAIAWLPLAARWLDRDRDGYLSSFGGRDCDGTNPAIFPGSLETPNNGIDEDCSGTDLKLAGAKLILGKTRHPAPKGLARRPHILLITADGLSYRHTSLGDYARDITPGLAAFATRATNFTQAFSVSSATDVSFPALLTGRYPLELPLEPGKPNVRPFRLAQPGPTLASVLKREGYRSVFIPPSPFFLQWDGLVQDTAVVRSAVDAPEEAVRAGGMHRAELVTQAALAALESADSPMFVWAHYYDMHWPYSTPHGEAPFGSEEPVDRYDAEVRFADRHWTRLITEVERRYPAEERIIVFTADHGEAFDEQHGDNARHNAHLHTSELHVPLVVQGPWRAGDNVDGLTSHLDLWPTLASLLSIEPLVPLRGESLVPALVEGRKPEKNVVYGFFFHPNVALTQVSVRTPRYHLLHWRSFGRFQLFDWQKDPWEQADLGTHDAGALGWLGHLASQVVRDFEPPARGR